MSKAIKRTLSGGSIEPGRLIEIAAQAVLKDERQALTLVGEMEPEVVVVRKAT